MEVITSNDCQSDFSPSYTAAGILPYCHFGGQLLFLLGKEEFFSNRGGSSRGVKMVWSDFGGRREESDTDEIHTAAREFAEETLGIFEDLSLSEGSVARCTTRMMEVLRQGGPGVMRAENGLYTMFLCSVPYFIGDLMFQLAKSESPSSEKLDFAWVTADELIGATEGSFTPDKGTLLCGKRHLLLFHKFVITCRRLCLSDAVSKLQRLQSESICASTAPQQHLTARVGSSENGLLRRRLGIFEFEGGGDGCSGVRSTSSPPTSAVGQRNKRKRQRRRARFKQRKLEEHNKRQNRSCEVDEASSSVQVVAVVADVIE